jgi:2-phospho-L-lactate guanylyltransferase
VSTGPVSPVRTPVAALLVPVKAFDRAKARLAPARSPQERADLARAMAATVLAAAGGLRTAVVCDDEAVRVWAEEQGAEAIWTPGLGLNGAVEAGVAHLAQRGVDQVVVAHADLPLASDLAWLSHHHGVTLVPDRRRDGTNVICVPATAGFRFAYGAASFEAHRAEAARLGLVTRLVADVRLGWDVDEPADLDVPDALQPPEYLSRVPTAPCC